MTNHRMVVRSNLMAVEQLCLWERHLMMAFSVSEALSSGQLIGRNSQAKTGGYKVGLGQSVTLSLSCKSGGKISET